MTHDPSCPWVRESWWDNSCVVCDLIAAVRKDQTQRCIEAIEGDSLHDSDPDWSGTHWNNAVFQCAETLRALLGNDSAPDPASTDKP